MEFKDIDMWVIHPNMTYEQVTVERKKVSFDTRLATFDELLSLHLGRPSSYVEHVSVNYRGKHCDMFVNENGHALGLPVNAKASIIYWAHTLLRDKVLTEYPDPLDVDSKWATHIHQDVSRWVYQTQPSFIVGTAVLFPDVKVWR